MDALKLFLMSEMLMLILWFILIYLCLVCFEGLGSVVYSRETDLTVCPVKRFFFCICGACFLNSQKASTPMKSSFLEIESALSGDTQGLVAKRFAGIFYPSLTEI